MSGFIGRMFSGLTGDSSEIRKYEEHTAGGGAVLVLDVADSDDIDRARAAMGPDVAEYDASSATRERELQGTDKAARANEAIATAAGPEGNALPNAPSGWETSRAGSPSTIGRVGHDPARPQGLTRDTQGLTDGDGGPAHVRGQSPAWPGFRRRGCAGCAGSSGDRQRPRARTRRSSQTLTVLLQAASVCSIACLRASRSAHASRSFESFGASVGTLKSSG